MKRVIAYVDGFNLYYGLRSKGWKRFYWLNVQQVARSLLRPDQILVDTQYFTTIITNPRDKHDRQATFLDALRTLPDFHIYYGHYLEESITCRKCGHTYVTYHEKMTDVNIAIHLLSDAYEDRFDIALLVSADGDLVGLAQTVRRLFGHKQLIVAFPPDRSSKALKQAAHAYVHVNHAILRNSLLPDQISRPDGFILYRPPEWR